MKMNKMSSAIIQLVLSLTVRTEKDKVEVFLASAVEGEKKMGSSR